MRQKYAKMLEQLSLKKQGYRCTFHYWTLFWAFFVFSSTEGVNVLIDPHACVRGRSVCFVAKNQRKLPICLVQSGLLDKHMKRSSVHDEAKCS